MVERPAFNPTDANSGAGFHPTNSPLPEQIAHRPTAMAPGTMRGKPSGRPWRVQQSWGSNAGSHRPRTAQMARRNAHRAPRRLWITERTNRHAAARATSIGPAPWLEPPPSLAREGAWELCFYRPARNNTHSLKPRLCPFSQNENLQKVRIERLFGINRHARGAEVAPQLTVVEPIQAKNGTFVVIDLRNWPNLGGTTGEPAAPRLIAELPSLNQSKKNITASM